MVDLFDIVNVTHYVDGNTLLSCLFVHTPSEESKKPEASSKKPEESSKNGKLSETWAGVPLLRLQVFFRCTWFQLLGVHASKHDFQTFLRSLSSAAAPHGLSLDAIPGPAGPGQTQTEKEQRATTIRECVRSCVRQSMLSQIFAMMGHLGQRPSQADLDAFFYEHVHEDVGAACEQAFADLRRFMLDKWVDRFGARKLDPSSDTAILAMASPLNTYATIIARETRGTRGELRRLHPQLPLLPDDTVSNMGQTLTPKQYYNLIDRALAFTSVRCQNLVTGMLRTQDTLDRESTPWSLHEAVRHVMTRDVHFASTLPDRMHIFSSPCENAESLQNGVKRLVQFVCSSSKAASDHTRLDGVAARNMPCPSVLLGPKTACVRVFPLNNLHLQGSLCTTEINWPQPFHSACRSGMKAVDIVLTNDIENIDFIENQLQWLYSHVSASPTFVLKRSESKCDESSAHTVLLAAVGCGRSSLTHHWPLLLDMQRWFSGATPTGTSTMLRFLVPAAAIPNSVSDSDSGQEILGELAKHIIALHLDHKKSLSHLAFMDFLARYTQTILNDTFRVTNQEENIPERRAIVAIDTRPNILTALSVLVALSNLQRFRWNVVIITSQEAKEFYMQMLPPLLPRLGARGLRVCTPAPLSSPGRPFNRDEYNAFLKSVELWYDILGPYEEVLTVQDDGFLLRPGLEAQFCGRFDYVGAPWAVCPENASLKTLANEQLVGNGGLSLRNVAAMKSIVSNDAWLGRKLFLQDSQPLPEDVFFANRVCENGLRLCPRDLAAQFSVEQVLCPPALGMHRFWVYHDVATVINHLAGILLTRFAK